MQDLKGKVAFVTGGTSGIGRATVLALAKEGTHVAFTGRRQHEGDAVAAEARKIGAAHSVKVLFVQGDVTDEAHIERAVREALGLTGQLNFAFNNAGIEINNTPATEITADQYKRVFDINVLGVLLSMKHEIRAMLKSGGGSIVNTSSVAGSIGLGGAGIYVGSKHAVNGITKSAALEVAKQNIRINTISPGGVETAMLDRFTGNRNPDMIAWMNAAHPIGRVSTPDEIARPVLFLFSNAASFITGQDLVVDGGFTAQ